MRSPALHSLPVEKTILTKSPILPDVKLIHTQNHGIFHWKVPLGGIERHWNQLWPSHSLSFIEVGIHAMKIECLHSYPDWQNKWGPGDHVRDGSLAPEFCTAEGTEIEKGLLAVQRLCSPLGTQLSLAHTHKSEKCSADRMLRPHFRETDFCHRQVAAEEGGRRKNWKTLR